VIFDETSFDRLEKPERSMFFWFSGSTHISLVHVWTSHLVVSSNKNSTTRIMDSSSETQIMTPNRAEFLDFGPFVFYFFFGLNMFFKVDPVPIKT